MIHSHFYYKLIRIILSVDGKGNDTVVLRYSAVRE